MSIRSRSCSTLFRNCLLCIPSHDLHPIEAGSEKLLLHTGTICEYNAKEGQYKISVEQVCREPTFVNIFTVLVEVHLKLRKTGRSQRNVPSLAGHWNGLHLIK